MNSKSIHKWVDCEDGWTAMIHMEYNPETYEVLHEYVIFSNKKKEDE